MELETLYTQGNRYEDVGVYSLAIRLYETCLFYGVLPVTGYKRLIRLYLRKGDKDIAERVLARYNAIYKVL